MGYVSYKVTGLYGINILETTSWLSEELNSIGQLFSSSMNGVFDVWNDFSLPDEAYFRKSEGFQPESSSPSELSQNEQFMENVNYSVNGGGGNEFFPFIKKMIEIRNALKIADNSSDLKLPSIVVIGSQSSGKSSVLEAIVGHEFLPKGQNMVTRRPLELTLVNSAVDEDYAEFPDLKLGKIKDFSKIQKILTDLNAAVPDSEAISNNPIELIVYSKNVPDLSLVDLPGYIQIHNRHQPSVLKEKIVELCAKYIREPNIILAVSAADVDLANSESLKASRLVDPLGLRTIGVITKMDLVDPKYGADLLENNNYPLVNGYVGVVCKNSHDKSNKQSAMIEKSPLGQGFEEKFFKSHETEYEKCKYLGIGCLRSKLLKTLEGSMATSLDGVLQQVQIELDELSYQFKVEYSDKFITPESYFSYLTFSMKANLNRLSEQYSRSKIREQIRKVLNEKLISVCEATFWNDPKFTNIMNESKQPHWAARLNEALSSYSKSGIGRTVTNDVIANIIKDFKEISTQEPFTNHPRTMERLIEIIRNRLKIKSIQLVNQIENAIKPLKSDFEYTQEDWKSARDRCIHVLESHLGTLKTRLSEIHSTVGSKTLRNAVNSIKSQDENINPELSSVAREAVFINHKVKLLNQRIMELSSDSCIQLESVSEFSKSNSWMSWFRFGSSDKDPAGPRYDLRDPSLPSQGLLIYHDPCQSKCPEIYLSILLEKMLAITSSFIHFEFVSEFLSPTTDLTDEKDSWLVPCKDSNALRELANENESVKKHLLIQERKVILERVREQLLKMSQERSINSSS